MLFKFVLVLLLAVILGSSFYVRFHQGKNASSEGAATFVEPLLLPVFILLLAVVMLLADGMAGAAETIRTCFMLFLQISAYFAVLMCLMPLLRQRISARACAALWLLPNLLYVTFNINNLAMTEPLFLLPLPSPQIQKALVVIWLAGFVAVLLWQVISHLRFRHRLLENAEVVTDPIVLAEWNREQWRQSIHRRFDVFYSDQVSTPVTVGCFASTVRLVLPRREYTQEELTLIFRHELRHVKRLDMRTKVFLTFCAAICWFNPLMWAARRKASEDLELSCDEEVLKDADEAARRRYAELLLRTAGDSRGFSTCLSADAASLRYRLKNVVSPRGKGSGAVCVAAGLFVLLMSGNAIAFVEQSAAVKEAVFSRYPAGTTIDSVFADNLQGEPSDRQIYGWQEDKLVEYIGSLRVRRVYSDGYDAVDIDGREVTLSYTIPGDNSVEAWTHVTVRDDMLWANIPYDGVVNSVPYLMEDEIDWDYVASLLDFDAPEPEPIPQPPRWIQAEFKGGDIEVSEPIHVSGNVLGGSRGGVEISPGEYYNENSVSGVSGYPVTGARLIFPYPPEDYEVRVENWDRTGQYTILGREMEKDSFSLAPYSAHYTVYARFLPVEGTVYEMSYSFDVELPEE